MRRVSRRVAARAALGVFALASTLAGCAAARPPTDPAVAGGDAMTWVGEGDVDLEDVDLAIGSRDGPEQEILGWPAVEAARAAGANVHQDIGAGGTAVVRRAQLSGLIDAYWEYTGTGWTRVLQQSDPATTSNELYEAVRDRDGEQNQIDWLPPAPMDGAWAIAASPTTIDDLGVRTLADLAATFERRSAGDGQSGPVLCLDAATGFADAPDGLRQFERSFDVVVPEARRPGVSTDLIFGLVAQGGLCQFGQVRNTDPRLVDGSLRVLPGDGVFTTENPSMTIRADVADDVPAFSEVVAALSPRLTDTTMRALRSAVEIDGRSPRSVARQWLIDEGLTEARTGEG